MLEKQKVFKVADAGRGFATREKGKAVFECFQSMLGSEPVEQDGVIVDWSGVYTASPGFIDEFIGCIFDSESAPFQSYDIAFTGDNPSVNDLVDRILKRRGIQLKFGFTPDDLETGEVRIFGKT